MDVNQIYEVFRQKADKLIFILLQNSSETGIGVVHTALDQTGISGIILYFYYT